MDDLTKKTPDESAYQTSKFLYKSLVQLIPGFGGTASEFFELIISDPAIKRRDRFMMELAEQLDTLAEHGIIEIEELLNNEKISALITQAIQTAIRSHGELKMTALKNATINGFLHKPDEEHLGLIVIGLLDRLTEPHIAILKEFAALPGHDKRMTNSSAAMLGVAFSTNPETLAVPVSTVGSVEGKQEYFDDRSCQINRLILSDLISAGLLRTHLELPAGGISNWSTDPSQNGADYLILTELGTLVVKEIEAPILQRKSG